MKEQRAKRNDTSLFIVLWAAFLVILFCSQAFGAIPASERDALIALYNSTNGDNWYNNYGWKTPPLAADGFALPGTEKSWGHITCNNTNTAVQGINLRNERLQGVLPPELGNLTNLLFFEINDNHQLTGNIPPELGKLVNLQSLDIGWTDLNGTIPPELGSLKSLESLSIKGCDNLTGSIPPELGSLINLKRLQIRHMYGLTGSIPPELGNLTNLQELVILGCERITGKIPPELGNLTNLETLEIVSCEGLAGGIPPELGNLTNLEYLMIDHCTGLTGNIAPELGNLAKLRILYLHSNNLSGCIPPELGNLTNLISIWLQQNNLTGSIPPELGNMTNLTIWFDLSQNNLTGSIPPELAKLANLWILYLYDNNLSGSIPPELSNMTGLSTLSLNNNNLSGSIPPELGNLTKLASLYIYNNNLSGSIPPELGSMANLRRLMLCNNNLSGEIPAALGNLTWLENLDLSSNRLSGKIPAALQDLVYLGEDEYSGLGLKICWNALYTKNAALRDFIDLTHDLSCNWESTQTVAPGQVSASAASSYSIDLRWKPVIYTTDPGCYRIFYRDTAHGPFKFFGKTDDKYASSKTVTGLKPGTTYYFTIRTRTYPHSQNRNTVDSEFSPIVSATTETVYFTISGTVTAKGSGLGGVALTLSHSGKTVKGIGAAGFFETFSDSGETVFTDARGYYSAVVKYGWSGKMTPVKGYYRFTPVFRSYAPVFTDQTNQDFSAVFPLSLTIRSERRTDRAFIISRDYGFLNLQVENNGDIPGLRFVIERKVENESYRAIKEFSAAELFNGAYVYYDKFLEQDKAYTYRLKAYDSDGSFLDISNETSI